MYVASEHYLLLFHEGFRNETVSHPSRSKFGVHCNTVCVEGAMQ